MKKTFSSLLLLSAFIASIALPATAKADTWFSCQAIEVMEFSNRIHVRCSNTITVDGDVVRWLAISKTDQDRASRFFSAGTSAILSGKFFRVVIPESSSTNVSGCLASDCRTPSAFGVRD
jgi:hypothetical protein